MTTRQVTIAFDSPQDAVQLCKLLSNIFPHKKVTMGLGMAVNGIHQNWILVHDDE